MYSKEEVRVAFLKSICKWEQVVIFKTCGVGTAGCGLCKLFNSVENKYNDCPIRLDTGLPFCEGSPYEEYEDADDMDDLEDAATAELAYLIDLFARWEAENVL